MIPPLPPIRHRSIAIWLQQQPNPPSAAALSSRVLEMDAQMIEAFESLENARMEQLMKDGIWGTEKGMSQFPMDRIELWNEVVSDFLTSEPSLET